MTKLTDSQHALLTEAAREGDAARSAHAPTTVAALIKRGMLLSIPIADGPSRLQITEAGRAAIGQIELPAAQAAEPAAPEAAHASAPTPKGKIGALLTLLRQPQGATIEAMMFATGWQAHSVRGAIAGAIKKNLGVAVSSEKTEAGRVYKAAAQGQP